jgi:hypothetical protein
MVQETSQGQSNIPIWICTGNITMRTIKKFSGYLILTALLPFAMIWRVLLGITPSILDTFDDYEKGIYNITSYFEKQNASND